MPCPHSHSHHCSSRSSSISALKKTLILVVVFMLIEFIFGWISNSLALMTDALHMFTDGGAIILSLFAFWIAQRPANKHLSYGYHRAEIIAALASGFSTWALSIWLIYEAIHRLIHPEPVQGPMVLIVACIGLCANLVMMLLLHRNQKENLNVRGAYVHILGDLLGSLGVVLAGILLIIFKWYPIDPIITLIFSIIVIYSAWQLIRDTLRVLMEGTPLDIIPEAVKEDLQKIIHVKEVHDLHIWSLSSQQINLSVHLVSTNLEVSLKEAHKLLKEKYQIHHATIQMEPLDGFDCQPCYFHPKS